jgi:MOSC domain-containing protein YiiM
VEAKAEYIEGDRKMNGKVFSINYSKKKGISKTPIPEAMLIDGLGLEGDAHLGEGLRQVSLLAIESIRKQGECPKVKETGQVFGPGVFAENITTEGIDLTCVKIEDRYRIGHEVIIEISKIGKECHRYCSIYYKTGDCIMPKEGIFARVIKGGLIRTGDRIEVVL